MEVLQILNNYFSFQCLSSKQLFIIGLYLFQEKGIGTFKIFCISFSKNIFSRVGVLHFIHNIYERIVEHLQHVCAFPQISNSGCNSGWSSGQFRPWKDASDSLGSLRGSLGSQNEDFTIYLFVIYLFITSKNFYSIKCFTTNSKKISQKL